MPCRYFLLACTFTGSVTTPADRHVVISLTCHYLGLAAQGIDPASGQFVGGYVVSLPLPVCSNILNNTLADLGRRFG